MEFITYEHLDRPSPTTPEWCTLRFNSVGGIVSLLSRDKIRSTRKVWNAIGHYGTVDNGSVNFTEDSRATRLAATQMARNGAEVFFFGKRFVDTGEYGATAALPSNGRVTKPSTIRNGGTQVRRTSLDLGLLAATGATHGNYKPRIQKRLTIDPTTLTVS